MSKARFVTETLRQLAGETTFSRGLEYHRAGYVQILTLSPKRVVAEVAGTENYRTVVTGRDKEIDGNCSCPAFSDRGFCKHMVATALAANAAGDDAEGEAASALSRIREHLKAKGTDKLVDLILDLAEENPELFRKLDMDSAIVQADDKTLEQRLRKGIDGATRTGTYVDYQQARQWQAGVESVLGSIAELASGERAAVALKLAEHAIKRIENAFEAIDDSDGHIGSLLAQARDIHLTAAEAVRPEPVALARELFQREIDDEFGTFAGAVVDYSDVLGERGLAEYRRLASAEWKKLSKGSGRAGADAGRSFAAGQLIAILDFFAERDGDVEARITLRASDLSSQWDYLRLAEFCLSQGREGEALRRAEEGLWLFEDARPDERLLFFATKLLAKARRKTDAEAHLWRAFQKAPSLDIYKQLRVMGGEAAAERALALLESRQSGNKRGSWENRAGLLIEALMHEKRFDAAWSAVHKFGASDYTREKLVLATDVDYPREALEFYIARVERLANGAAYAEAVKVIARMAKLRSAAEHAAFMTDLRLRHGRKRSLHEAPWVDDMRRGRIEEQNRLMLVRQREFRVAADVVTDAWMAFPEVQAVAVIGSVAKPLWKEVPRFTEFRRERIEVWHECGDLDMALWIDSQDRLGSLRRAAAHALRAAYERGAGTSVVSQQLDVFLIEPGSDDYLGRLCKFNTCPKGKRDCEAPGCGEIAFNKKIPDFKPGSDLLEPAAYARLYERGKGRLRSALDLAMVVADREQAKCSTMFFHP